MNILTKQINEEVLTETFDLAIYSSGYEPRSTFIFSKKVKSKYNIVFGFESFKDHPTRIHNDQYFEKQNCKIWRADGNDRQTINDILTEFVALNPAENINIFVDYSSMTRVWYGEIISYFNDNVLFDRTVEITFGYSFALYQPPPEGSYRNLYVSPIDGFSYFSVPNKPTAVVIGLGYEKNKAFGLSEYFDGKTFLFYNNDAKDPRFSKDIEEINKQLIEDTPEENIYIFPINDLEFAERQLSSLCGYLKQDYRVIIAPSGPKPFTLLSMIIAVKMTEIDVWRISQGDNRNPVQYKASGNVSYYKLIFDYKSV